MVSLTESQKSVFIILGFLVLANVLAWVAVYDLAQPRFLEVTFFDIGQGDAIFIESPVGHQILIDGGPGKAVLEKLAEEMPFWDRTIDLVILSHPEHDHIAGLIEVLKRYKVKDILWTGILRDTAEYAEWQRLLEGRDDRIAKSGQKVIISDALFDILYPFENLEGKEVKNPNNSSVIFRLVFEETSFLFTGDVYKSVEKELLDKGVEIDSGLLKVGHHGSKTSSDSEFIAQVSPEIAVISAGRENHYGHPHEETLKTLNEFGINILRTDKQGDIKIVSDGKNLKFNEK